MPGLVPITFALIAVLGLICVRGAWRSMTEGTRSQQIGGLVLILVGAAMLWFGGTGLYRAFTRSAATPAPADASGGGGVPQTRSPRK